ncbi:MAG: GGDEF domain-containing response regulator [Bacillota bacterium]
MNEKIMVIDDDRLISRIISDCLEKEGFFVTTAVDCTSGLEKIYHATPDIILLDVVLPDMNGYELCRVLRNDTRIGHIPIVMLTSRDTTEDKVAGLEAGADDYITKPFAIPELVARVKTHLRRAHKEKSFNPLTGLPGNKLIEEEIGYRITKTEKGYAVLYLDLDNFKAYNDHYGFLKGDSVIKLMAEIIKSTVKDAGNPNDFIGHIGGDDFISITTLDKVEKLCQEIIGQFDQVIPLTYSPDDRRAGYIITKNRENKQQKFPMMTLSIAVISNKGRQFQFPWEVAAVAAHMKKAAKSRTGSVYVFDQVSQDKLKGLGY